MNLTKTIVAAKRTAMLASLSLLALGCGGGSLETAPVTGTVTLDGKPLPHGMVVFSPERGRGATGQIESDGSFTLSTYGNGDGAVVGPHRVAVMCSVDLPNPSPNPDNPDDGMWKRTRSLIPTKYTNSATSGLTFDVLADTDNVANLPLSQAVR
jgi:hypothetical protein